MNRMKNFLVFMLAALPACTVVAQQWITLEKNTPAELFGEKCGMCHRGGGMGTGILARRMPADLALLENRQDLQPALIETAVRTGFGIMFPISRAELSDPQLQSLISYLVKSNPVASSSSSRSNTSVQAGRP